MTMIEWSSFLGNIGEFVGAVAVVATLIYIAAQVKLGKEATEANTRQLEVNRKLNLVENYMRRSERVEGGYRDGALSEDMSRLYFKFSRDPDSLDEFESFRLREWMHAHMHRLDSQHFQYQQGFLEEEAYENLKRVLRQFGPLWKQYRVTPPRQSFQDEVDELLKDEAPGDPPE